MTQTTDDASLQADTTPLAAKVPGGWPVIGLTSVVWLSLRHVRPDQILTFGAFLQTGRLLGAAFGAAFIQTFVRGREQVYSNLIGLHVAGDTTLTDQRLQNYTHAVLVRSIGAPEASARSIGLLAHAVQAQAYVLAFVDAFRSSASRSSLCWC